MSDEQGSSLLEILVIGVLVALIALQALVVHTRVAGAGEEVAAAADMAASRVARSLDAADGQAIVDRISPEASVAIEIGSTEVSVEVTRSVSLIGPERSPVQRTVTGRAVVPINQFRSRP